MAVPKPTVSKVGVTSIWLTWSAPESGGRAPIEFYRIEQQVGGPGDYLPIVENGIAMEDTGDADVEREITGLNPALMYAFRVQAVNIYGDGDFSEGTDAVLSGGSTATGPIETKLTYSVCHSAALYKICC